MKTSVVVAVYRGKKYLREQLDSLAHQSRKPDEVLIFDDCSEDGTAEFVDCYIRHNHLTNWKLTVNPDNIGWKNNFLNGFRQAGGDLIFPCDQDDVWAADKIISMEKIMEENPAIMLLASNYIPLYENGSSKLSQKVIKNMKFDESVEVWPFDEKFLFVARPGCSFCFRKELLNLADKIGSEDYAHDALVWRAALLTEGLYLYNRVTMNYRRHGENATGKKTVTPESKLGEMQRFLKAIEGMRTALEDPVAKNKERKIILLERCKKYILFKKRLYTNGNFFTWLRLVLGYRKFYVSARSAAGDLYLLKSRCFQKQDGA